MRGAVVSVMPGLSSCRGRGRAVEPPACSSPAAAGRRRAARDQRRDLLGVLGARRPRRRTGRRRPGRRVGRADDEAAPAVLLHLVEDGRAEVGARETDQEQLADLLGERQLRGRFSARTPGSAAARWPASGVGSWRRSARRVAVAVASRAPSCAPSGCDRSSPTAREQRWSDQASTLESPADAGHRCHEVRRHLRRRRGAHQTRRRADGPRPRGRVSGGRRADRPRQDDRRADRHGRGGLADPRPARDGHAPVHRRAHVLRPLRDGDQRPRTPRDLPDWLSGRNRD